MDQTILLFSEIMDVLDTRLIEAMFPEANATRIAEEIKKAGSEGQLELLPALTRFYTVRRAKEITAREHLFLDIYELSKDQLQDPPQYELFTKGDEDDAEALKALTAIRDFYLKHKERLGQIRQAREEYQAAAAAWHAAHPPQPQNHTFWLKPHRGSRYLKEEGGER